MGEVHGFRSIGYIDGGSFVWMIFPQRGFVPECYCDSGVMVAR